MQIVQRNNFITDNGSDVGPEIAITENTFMTIKAWEKITPMLMKGYRKINKHVEANPKWWFLDILDGFGAHFSSNYAMLEHQKNKIDSLKKEENLSHANQTYDNLVAQKDKSEAISALALLINFRFKYGSVMDQWYLIHIVLVEL